MKTSRLRRYLFLSVLLHLLFLWLLRFVPPAAPPSFSPVPIRVLEGPWPGKLPSGHHPQQGERRSQRRTPPPKPKRGGVVVDLPRPVQEERPDHARIVSRFDSRAQDVGPGKTGARKPSGKHPPQLPPELALPQRYSTTPAEPSGTTPSPPKQRLPVAPAVPRQRQGAETKVARRMPTPAERPQRPPVARPGTVPVPAPPEEGPAPQPEERRFRITAQQEVAMLQRPRFPAQNPGQQALAEHLAALEKRLPLPTFDAPGVYEQGPERPGEGGGEQGGGKYRSLDAFGLQHFSYLLQVKRKIELVFSVPFFVPNHGAIGVPIVGFTIRRSGELAEAVLLRSSGYAVLDKALLEAVRRAAPFGPFPQHLPDKEISIRVYAAVS